jgi:glutamyl/glutaminyl-tRNA synthetase
MDDNRLRPQQAVAGRDFGDFLVWRKDDVPSYQLACVVDDASHGHHRGRARRRPHPVHLSPAPALSGPWATRPAFYHCPLLRDENGERLAKRHDALSLRTLRAQGMTPEASGNL